MPMAGPSAQLTRATTHLAMPMAGPSAQLGHGIMSNRPSPLPQIACLPSAPPPLPCSPVPCPRCHHSPARLRLPASPAAPTRQRRQPSSRPCRLPRRARAACRPVPASPTPCLHWPAPPPLACAPTRLRCRNSPAPTPSHPRTPPLPQVAPAPAPAPIAPPPPPAPAARPVPPRSTVAPALVVPASPAAPSAAPLTPAHPPLAQLAGTPRRSTTEGELQFHLHIRFLCMSLDSISCQVAKHSVTSRLQALRR
jgi:hypothetical protein